MVDPPSQRSVDRSRPLKIAIASSGFLPVVDGVTLSVLRRVERLSEWGHEVALFCPGYQKEAATYPNWRDYTGEILPKITVHSLPSMPFVDRSDRNVAPGSHRIMVRELRRFQPDVIHIDEPERMFAGFLRVPCVRFARRTGTPCLSFFHTNFLEYGEDYIGGVPRLLYRGIEATAERLLRWVYNCYDSVLVSSKITAAKLVDLGLNNVRHANLLGVDIAAFAAPRPDPNFFANRYGIEGVDDKVKVLFLGRLAPDKGWAFTLDALERAVTSETLRKAAIIVVGDGELEREVSDRLHAVSDHAHLLGSLEHDLIPPILVNCDLHVTASQKETLGLTVMEAMAASTPALVPRCGGVMEHLQDGINGLVFEPNDAASFGAKLATLLNDAELRERMGRAGQQQMQAFDWDRTTSNLVAIWEEAVAGDLR